MGGWLDKWAKRAATAAPLDDPSTEVESSAATRPHASRRDFLKKAGIVGGVAWSIPVMQTVLAPSASASGPTVCSGGGGTCGTLVSGPGPCLPCATGVQCSAGADCATGVGCSSRSGTTVCGGPGATCGTGADCVFSNCTSGICGFGTGTGQQGAPCGTPNGGTSGAANSNACQAGWNCGSQGGQQRCRTAA